MRRLTCMLALYSAKMTTSRVKSLRHCVFELHYHLVLATKYRHKVLTSAMLSAFAEQALGQRWRCSRGQARERCAAWGGELLECNGGADHVHLLLPRIKSGAAADCGPGGVCERT